MVLLKPIFFQIVAELMFMVRQTNSAKYTFTDTAFYKKIMNTEKCCVGCGTQYISTVLIIGIQQFLKNTAGNRSIIHSDSSLFQS